MYGEEERMEPGEGEESINRSSRVKLLTLLILILLILTPIILFAYFHYLPLNDIEAKVDHTYRNYEEKYNYSEVVLLINFTNSGAISHGFFLTGSVMFNTEPNTTFTNRIRMHPLDAGKTLSNVRNRVPVPNELLQDDYNTSISIGLLPFFNKYTTDGIVFFTLVWLLVIAAVSTSLVRSWRKER